MTSYKFDMGEPLEMTSEEIAETLKTIPKETLDEYGISLDGEGTDTPHEAVVEGEVFAMRLNGEGLTRMVREGYTITDKADFYWFGHQKWSGRGGKKPGYIIPHHMAGNLSVNQFYAIMASSREMSATISIHTDGTVYAWVPEEMRPWTTGSYTADQDALTMEIANDEIGGDWHISDTAYNLAVEIAAEWCKRYGIDPYWKPGAMGTIQEHKQWASTACPGPYMSRKIESGQFEKDIRAILNPPKPPTPTPTPTPSNVIYKVQCGAFKVKKNAENLKAQLNAKGLNAFIKDDGDYFRVQCGAFKQKANAEGLVKTLKAKGFKPIIKEEKLK